MKGIRLLLAVLLAPLVFQGAVADDGADSARATVRRTSSQNISSARKNTTNKTSNSRASGTSKSTNSGERGTTTGPRGDTTIKNTGRTALNENRTVSARTTSNVMPRATSAKTAATTVQPRSTKPATRTPTVARTAATTRLPATNTASRSRAANIARNTTDTNLRDQIMSRDFSKCRTVYYDCMDEFCANKDAQLKRCACSVRVNEFDSTKKQLAKVEDKLLEFNQRLLTVNLDKEDAAAINTATEGETAFDTKDQSESKKMLDSIAKKLNTSFSDSNFNQDLSAISLSLNMDAAFDNIDSLAGASTTTKSGTALYSAALPVCREMAMEVCSAEDLAVAESGYQMAIEQDCNTVAKSYQTQTDQAREQVLESSALLDMSRLDIHQKRNSDDILTCKSKMIDMLTDTTVCGDNLSKCLDTTGRYIDPSTGEAFLTVNLVDLGKLIIRPSDETAWSKVPGNEKFVSYLNTKKKFLEPAMEKCQDIADTVWANFIDDALAQIKLAQDKKLEEVRQSCTTLTTQCLADTAESIEDFDARALSTFGVLADKTVNEMCSDVRNACTALLESAPDADTDWSTGMTGIATNKTYDTILQTCTEVGRSCIIQACKSISGNFGLCENIDTSINRKSIINRTACWNEVVQCIRDAGTTSLANIREEYPLAKTTIGDKEYFSFDYNKLYGGNKSWIDIIHNGQNTDCINFKENEGQLTNIPSKNCIYNICASECSSDNTEECYICRFAERIWGNCENAPQTVLASDEHNMIKIPHTGDTDTLLAWFAKNTGTADMPDSCRDTTCGVGFINYCTQQGICSCKPSNGFDSAGQYCESGHINISSNITNCCDGSKDQSGNCCVTSITPSGQFMWSNYPTQLTDYKYGPLCGPAGSAIPYAAAGIATTTQFMICIGDTVQPTGETDTEAFPNGTTIECDGDWLLVQQDTATSKTKYLATTHENMYLFYRTNKDDTYYYRVTNEPNPNPVFKKCGAEDTAYENIINNYQVTFSDPCISGNATVISDTVESENP